MSSFGVQQPHTFRQSRPHSRGLHYLLFLPRAAALAADAVSAWRGGTRR